MTTTGTPIDLAKMRSIGVISKRTGKPQIVTGVDQETGNKTKATTDELGNTVTEHSIGRAPGVSERQDVLIRPGTARLGFVNRGDIRE